MSSRIKYDSAQAASWLEMLQTTKKGASDLIGVSRPRFDKILEQGASDTEALAMKFVEREHLQAARLASQMSPMTAVKLAFENIESIYRKEEGTTDHDTGIELGDEGRLVLPSPGLVVVTGPPSSGKSSLLRQLVSQKPMASQLAYLCLEQPMTEAVIKLMCQVARIHSSHIKTARLSENDWARLIKAAGDLSEANVSMIGQTWALDDIIEHVHALHATRGLDAFVLDGLGLVEVHDARSRSEELARVVRKLKKLAYELGILVVTSAHTQSQTARHKRPSLADIEQAPGPLHYADTILALHREELFDPNSELRGIAELHTLKHPDGQLRTTPLRFFPQYGRFEPLSEKDRQDAFSFL
jgi:replicative DNA helicase